MKKITWIALSISALSFSQIAYAQKAKISSAQISLQDGKVMDAKKDIDAALQDVEIQKRVDAWTTKGEVYKDIYETKIYYALNPNCLFEAKDAYIKASDLELNPKKQKNFTTPLTNIQGYLFNEGLGRFNSQKYDDAYKHFDAARTINEFLLKKGLATVVDTNIIYATAMSGVSIGKTKEVTPLLQKLIEMNYNNAAVYESLAQIYETNGDKEALNKLIKKGLERFPNSKNLQIYELNQTLDGGDLKESIAKFEKALASDPKNASIAFNLGVLYDKLQNMDKTKEYYEKAIALKADYGDAYFNLGVMYFNLGVAKNKEMNAVDDAKDKDGKIYAGLKAERDALFQQALPNLEKSYHIDPKNKDYKANLKKVYASMNMLDKAKALDDE